MVGDSLTVGGFGQALQDTFIKVFGADKVAVYGSCGASVEHFLNDEPVFTCKCGYRETTSRNRILDDGQNGRRPRPHPTPKLGKLLRQHQPEVLIVQLGTNNFSSLHAKPSSLPDQRRYFERLALEMTRTTRSLRRVVWITPPDSTKFSSRIEKMVDAMILDSASRHGIYVIQSSKYTRYVNGKTGSDGVHYQTEAARAWAGQVIRRLNVILPPMEGRGRR
ncbi:MAG: SGNH/GDSL hydrolase family protein [Luteolibacter sp.]